MTKTFQLKKLFLIFTIFLNISCKDYSHLFNPTKLGNLEVINHFIRSATVEGKSTPEGYPTKDVIELYKKLAQGNIGVIVTSAVYITKNERSFKQQLGIYDDSSISHFKEITDYIHKNYKSKVIMQIIHASACNIQAEPEKADIIGPTAMTDYFSGLKCREMTKEDILKVQQDHVDAAIRAKKAGFDGVQIESNHGYLLAMFLTPLYCLMMDMMIIFLMEIVLILIFGKLILILIFLKLIKKIIMMLIMIIIMIIIMKKIKILIKIKIIIII